VQQEVVNFMPIRVVGRHVGSGCVVVLVVAIISYVFSFLGTLLCAALAGMMLGAARDRWLSLPCSAIFPAVNLILLRATKADVASHQIMVLSLVAFSAFWLTFGLTWLVVFFERKQSALSPGEAAPLPAGPGSDSPEEPSGLSLEMLQGQWSSTMTGQNRQGAKKVLVIKDDGWAVSLLDSNGEARLLAKGDVKVLLGTKAVRAERQAEC
jgi:hypothetical protein